MEGMDEKDWFWESPSNEQRGPADGLELVSMCVGATGSAEGVTPETLVWTEGMGSWEPFKDVDELMAVYIMLQPTQAAWTAPPGDHVVPPAFQEWITAMDDAARLSVFHTAMTKYMPAIMTGQEAARTALLTSYIMRHPEMEHNPALFNMSTPFLQNVLSECEGMDQGQFSEMLVIGNEQHIASLLTAAAQLDIKFMRRVENAYCMGEAVKCVARGDVNALMAHLDQRPGLGNARNLDGTCLLHQIVLQKQYALLRAALARNSDPSTTTPCNLECLDPEHNTPLHLAVAASDTDAAEMLLNSGADINAQNHDTSEYASGDWSVRAGGQTAPILAEHQTALHIAAEQVDPEMLETLLKRKPDLEVPDTSGMTALHVAVEQADPECVELLLKAGCQADTTNTVFGEGSTCLHSAASRGLTRIVKLLLKHQPAPNVNAANAEGWTPLQLAARKGSAAAVELLVKGGADAAAVNQQGQTAMSLADVNKRQAVVELLKALSV